VTSSWFFLSTLNCCYSNVTKTTQFVYMYVVQHKSLTSKVCAVVGHMIRNMCVFLMNYVTDESGKLQHTTY